ncbi:MAG: hypothetical protein QNJ38_24565 [Prochloraceae cyanobacterium]|nr:hypothetical protein [Prochloraceae cyanobacterium]
MKAVYLPPLAREPRAGSHRSCLLPIAFDSGAFCLLNLFSFQLGDRRFGSCLLNYETVLQLAGTSF